MLPVDAAEEIQVGGYVLADLHRAGEPYVATVGWVVDHEFHPGVPAEYVVLRPVAGGGDVELLAVPEVPVGADVRAAVLADARDDDVPWLGEKGFDGRVGW